MFACVWTALIPLAMQSAHIGVLLWVWVALLSPNDLLYGFMAGVPFNKIVAASTFCLMIISREKKSPYVDATLLLLLLLAVTATISWWNGLVATDESNELYQKLIKEIVLAFVITVVMTTRHRLHMLVLTVALSLGFLAVKEGLISILTAGGHKIIGSGAVGDNNSLATALLMVIPLMYYLARYSAVRTLRIGLLAAAALGLITVIMTFSRGGFVGLMVLGLFAIRYSRNKLVGLAAVAAACCLIYTLAPESWFERLNTISDASNDSSFMGRVVAWKISWLLAMDRPFFGGGMHAVQFQAVWDAYRPLLPSLAFIPTPPADIIPHAAHSIYFEVLGDLGFVGLGLFISLLSVAFWNCRWIARNARHDPTLAWAADLAKLSQISLVIYVVTGAALSMGYFELIYILLAVLSRCRRIVSQTLTAGNPVTASEWEMQGIKVLA
jgi:probable O-glycosylation ligase (exosortase A-associated)